MNYSELKTAVANYFHRGDLTSRMGTFIALAEAALFREIGIKSSNISVDGTTADGVVALPADCKSVVSLTLSRAGVEYKLEYSPVPVEYSGAYTPSQYTTLGDALRIPGAGTGEPYTLTYTPKLAALSDTNTTNWLLENAPDLYLYATALQVAADLRNDAEAAKLKTIVSELLDAVRRTSDAFGQPTGTSLQIRPRR